MNCKIVPYTTEDDITLCEPFDKVMLSIGEPGDIPDHVLDNIPKEAAQIICDVINGKTCQRKTMTRLFWKWRVINWRRDK